MERSNWLGSIAKNTYVWGALLGLVFGLGVLSSGGCMRPQASPAEKLNTAIHSFHGHLLFARYDEAAGFMPASQRREFLDYYEEQGTDLRIGEYAIERLEICDDEKCAHAQVRLAWYRLPSTKLQKSQMMESWKFDEERSEWEVFEQDVQ